MLPGDDDDQESHFLPFLLFRCLNAFLSSFASQNEEGLEKMLSNAIWLSSCGYLGIRWRGGGKWVRASEGDIVFLLQLLRHLLSGCLFLFVPSLSLVELSFYTHLVAMKGGWCCSCGGDDWWWLPWKEMKGPLTASMVTFNGHQTCLRRSWRVNQCIPFGPTFLNSAKVDMPKVKCRKVKMGFHLLTC